MGDVLFICTGNIYRSMSAEYCLRDFAEDLEVSSAGTRAREQDMHPSVYSSLLSYGIDSWGHVQRKVTREILDDHEFVISMGRDHRDFLLAEFNLESLLFNEVAYDISTSVPDIHDVVANWQEKPKEVDKVITRTVDHIYRATPRLMEELLLK